MALAFVVGLSGMALASNMADVDQSSTDNEAYINQVGGSSNNNTIDIDQIAGTTNDAVVYQNGSGNDVDVIQNASSDYNNLYVEQLDPNGMGSGDDNILKLSQAAATDNDAEVYQWGNSNVLVGANSDGTINPSGAATQISGAIYNYLSCVQSGNGNEAGLYQNALSFNDASITQDNGGNSLVAWQNAPGGSNELTSFQNGGMTALVIQNATSGNNVASITQQ